MVAISVVLEQALQQVLPYPIIDRYASAHTTLQALNLPHNVLLLSIDSIALVTAGEQVAITNQPPTVRYEVHYRLAMRYQQALAQGGSDTLLRLGLSGAAPLLQRVQIGKEPFLELAAIAQLHYHRQHSPIRQVIVQLSHGAAQPTDPIIITQEALPSPP